MVNMELRNRCMIPTIRCSIQGGRVLFFQLLPTQTLSTLPFILEKLKCQRPILIIDQNVVLFILYFEKIPCHFTSFLDSHF